MSDLFETLPDLLRDLAQEHDVPGAQLAVLTPSGIVEAAHGVLNRRTGVETTTDAVFQLGSITKVWTATLAMQLVDEGLLDLDAPVVTYLPTFRIADPDVTAGVTTRHLLDHSNGIDGDLFLDTGRGDDAVEAYVAAMAELRAVAPLGAAMSYSNAAYTLLGHLVAQLRGKTWETVLRERLIEPLGLRTAGTLPEEALLHRAAVGHVDGPDGLVPASVWAPERSAGPAGLVHACARDVLGFAQLHLSGGLAPDGTRLLSAQSVILMQQPSTPMRDGRSIGLGWFLDRWEQQPVYGHDGGTIGQLAFLRVLPESGAAIAMGTNGPGGAAVFSALVKEVAPVIAGVRPPAHKWTPSGEPLPAGLDRLVGAYESVGTRYEVRRDGERLVLALGSKLPDSITQGEPALEVELHHGTEGELVARLSESSPWGPVHFLELPDGSSAIALGSRITPKVPVA